VLSRISTRFALMLAAAAVVPLLTYGAVSVVSLRAGTQEAVVAGNLDTARRVAEQIELYIATSLRILRAVAADLQQTGLEDWQKDRILKNFVLEFQQYREISLLDGAGRPLVTSRVGPAQVGVPGSDGTEVDGVLMSRFFLDGAGLPAADAAIPLAAPDGGWLVGRLSLEDLWRTVDSIRVGQGGYLLVVTRDGQLVAHGDPAAKAQVARGDNLLGHPVVSQLAGAPGPDAVATAEYPSGRGEVLGVGASLADLDWMVLVEQPTREAFAISNRIETQLGLAIALALTVTLGAGYFWGRRFIRPIHRLQRGTEALASGRLDERVPVEGTDELGQLGTAFNTMAARLADLQEDVRRKERHAMFGRVAMGLVHDLAHPIQNIGNNCKLIVRLFDDAEYRSSFKETIEKQLAHVKRMLDDLRRVARPEPIEPYPLDVNVSLAELVVSMAPTAETAGVGLEMDLCAEPLHIRGDTFALSRVYGNILNNAFQATNPRGTVTVRTRREEGCAVVEFADTGHGVPPERLDTLFDGFSTTRSRGLGLGLAIVKTIVEQLDGTIGVASELNLGTIFTLRFPLIAPPTPPTPPTGRQVPYRTRPGA
jgi:two-component system NtrC family sensor kinase